MDLLLPHPVFLGEVLQIGVLHLLLLDLETVLQEGIFPHQFLLFLTQHLLDAFRVQILRFSRLRLLVESKELACANASAQITRLLRQSLK